MPWRELDLQAELVFDPSMRNLCRRPYPGHPKGCPNWGRRETCPPKAPLLWNIISRSTPVWVVWNVFPFGEHVDAMHATHPDWSPRQLRCCLYWQGKARKQLREQVAAFRRKVTLLKCRILYVPEASGVDVTSTMALIGEFLEWPPETKTYQVALAGYPE